MKRLFVTAAKLGLFFSNIIPLFKGCISLFTKGLLLSPTRKLTTYDYEDDLL